MEGSPHLQDDEILDYETSQINDDDDISDDENDSGEEGFNGHLEADVRAQGSSIGRRPASVLLERRSMTRTSTPTISNPVGERRSMTRTSTPTNPKTNGNGNQKRLLYKGYNRTVEISDDDE